jgi:hypothetical protein
MGFEEIYTHKNRRAGGWLEMPGAGLVRGMKG